jgi:glycosyltransferase involved in cell wall biosynthesis
LEASVVIPARNASATLPLTLAGLAAQQGPPSFEVIVVDDGSSDDTVERARSFDGELPLRVLASSGGDGPGAARNLGAGEARGDVLVFIDADCEPEPEWLARIVAAARDAELVQGKVLPPPGVQVGPFDRFIAVVSEYGLYQTANLAIHRDVFERIGGFEQIVMPRRSKELGEDAWLAWRARRAGARSVFADDAVVRHAVFARRPAEFVAEQARVRFFPALTAHMPELRDAFLHRRWFLSHRSLRFDLAVAGVVGAAVLRSPLPLAAAAPYAKTLWTESAAWGPERRGEVAPVQFAADAVRAAALAWGSVRYRCPVL